MIVREAQAEAESAIKQAIQAAGVTAAVRCFHLDDAAGEGETETYPCVVVKATPPEPKGHPGRGFLDIIGSFRLDVFVKTDTRDDAEASAMSTLSATVRQAIEEGDPDQYLPEWMMFYAINTGTTESAIEEGFYGDAFNYQIEVGIDTFTTTTTTT